METYNFLATPPWDKDVDVLFTVRATDESDAYYLFARDYKAMYGDTPMAWRLLERSYA